MARSYLFRITSGSMAPVAPAQQGGPTPPSVDLFDDLMDFARSHGMRAVPVRPLLTITVYSDAQETLLMVRTKGVADVLHDWTPAV